MDFAAEPAQQVAFAQLRSLPPDTSSTGKVAVSLDIDRGANPSDEVNVDGNARWLRPAIATTPISASTTSETDGTTTDDDADANYQYDILRDEGWYWFGRLRSTATIRGAGAGLRRRRRTGQGFYTLR